MTGYKSKKAAALDEEGMYLVHHTKRKDDDDVQVSLAQPEFIKHEVENSADWSEWVCPDPDDYLISCCDCGLVHQAQFRVAKYAPAPSEECEIVNDPDLQAQFRMRRSEQWSPEDTAHRAGGMPMAQPEQEPRLDQGPDYERGFVDGMQKQMQSSVDKAVNAMSKRPWVYLTEEHIKEIVGPYALPIIGYTRKLFDQIEAKSKELNT